MSFGDWLSGVESPTGPFRVIERWGPNLIRHSTVLGTYHTLGAAFADLDQRVATLVEAGAIAGALQFFVVDAEWQKAQRPKPAKTSPAA